MWKGRRSFRRAAFDPTLGYWLGESPVRIRLSRQSKTAAYIDLGDQFLALQRGRTQAADDGCHFGPVADDMGAIRDALAEAGVDPLSGQFLISWTHRATV